MTSGMTGAPDLATCSPAVAGAAGERGGPDVCLVTMPYASPTRPSMALGLLKAILAEGGINASVTYANLWFAESVGLRRYSLCASNMPIVFLAGEWTFAGAAFPDDPRRAERDAEYLRQVRQASDGYPQVWSGARGGEFTADLLALRAAATEFVDEAARRVLATGARVIGCTSTFEQHVASLALLRRVRELDPGVITMLGGANCETVMGEATHRCFPWVDYVVSGEADGLVTELCRLALTRGRDVAATELPRGVLGPAHRQTRQGGAGARPAGRRKLPRALFQDLDSLPTPRYDEYFGTLAASPLGAHVRPGLPLESSRGCWWGAAHQCTFCGLNGTSLGYRSKSPERVLAERTMSMISKISSSKPKAATPPISSPAKVEDNDMARSLALRGIIALDLDQPAFHDRARCYVGAATSEWPAVERCSGLGITQTRIERPGSRVVMLNQHPGHWPTMIDDLPLQCRNQLSSRT